MLQHARAACDPDDDGEHTRFSGLAGSSGTSVMLPHSGCGINFASVTFSNKVTFDTFRGDISAPSVTIQVRIKVDGSVVGQGTFLSGSGGLRDLSLTSPVEVAVGTHSVRMEYSVAAGASWNNFWMDYFEATKGGDPPPPPPSCANPPTNAAPSAPEISGSDGLGSGEYGWAGVAYAFLNDGATDPDGDPVVYTWKWGDSKTTKGLESTHAYAGPGAFKVALSVTDDPSARNQAGCPALRALGAASETFTFTVIPDFVAAITSPESGTSCVAGTPVPTLGATVIAGACKIAAEVDTGTAPASLVEKVDFVLNDPESRPKATDRAAPYVWSYDSTKFAPGPKSMYAVAYAKNDKEHRAFPSEAFEYVNVGAGTA